MLKYNSYKEAVTMKRMRHPRITHTRFPKQTPVQCTKLYFNLTLIILVQFCGDCGMIQQDKLQDSTIK